MIRRTTDFIVVHCAATKPSQDIGAAEIRKWHVEDRGWDDIGYHQVIRRSGAIELGRPLHVAGAHAKGFNARSVGVCLVGGIDKDGNPANNFTYKQMDSLTITLDYWGRIYPSAEILGHRDLPGVDKACPCFDVREWLGG
jgi:N-acetyl-anhydromuramyl-L-alanine amidase AmpD